MEREIFDKLRQWKDSQNRKPLLLQGARQIGKTWIMREFGNLTREFEFVAVAIIQEKPKIYLQRSAHWSTHPRERI